VQVVGEHPHGDVRRACIGRRHVGHVCGGILRVDVVEYHRQLRRQVLDDRGEFFIPRAECLLRERALEPLDLRQGNRPGRLRERHITAKGN
jgi:hypothetical protein